ncbi:Gldg family protein [Scatolibacter rhodanostii]|uniref:Gldg family protein n=1 Tax=Scatolibacter rhodanostii TaxID=2014781 RepID=UPI000C07E641|nr:Gldg family protein [Scatolibacter rhodanostii]
MKDKQENKTTEVKATTKSKPSFLKSTKFKHGTSSVIMTVVFLCIIIVVNILASVLTDRFPSLNIDLTSQKINTLSEDAVEIAKSVQTDTQIIILASEDNADQLLNSGDMQYSQVITLAKKLQEVNSKIQVSFVDLDTNPQFTQEYSEYSLSTGSVIVKSNKRIKVLAPMVDLFSATQNQQTGGYDYTSKVDGALANALSLVNLEKVPTMAVANGHEELLVSTARAAFDKNLSDRGIDVVEFNIMTDDIPENADIIMIPTPSTDYTEAEITKLRTFLSDETAENSRSILYTADYSQPTMPTLESFLEEWGVKLQKAVVVETNTDHVLPGGDASIIFVNSSSELLSKNSYSYLVAPVAAPMELLFSGNDSISTTALWTSYDSTYVMENEDSDTSKTDAYPVATMSTKAVKKNGEYVNENVIVFSSSVAFTDNFINSSTFANKQFFTDLFSNLTGSDMSQVYIAPVTVNQYDIAASASVMNILGFGVFTVAIPLVIIAFGLVIFLRRRHL